MNVRKGWLRKGGEARPITATTQDMAICFWITGLVFFLIPMFFSPPVIEDNRVFYLFERETFFLFMILGLIFTFIGVAFPCYAMSKYNLNMFTDRLHKDWQGCIRVDFNGQVTNQIIRKDSLGFNRLIAYGKKAGVINRRGFKLNLQNGNSVIVTFDTMSHSLDLLEALGWTLYKKKHGIVGYNAYEKYLHEKKEYIESDEPKKKKRFFKKDKPLEADTKKQFIPTGGG